jgi:succinyl-diaminopimelate desuccinylase
LDPADIEDYEVAELTSKLIEARSPNPPGDVTAAADVALAYLGAHGLAHRLVRPASDRLNLLASVEATTPGPHVVLSGHLDTFPLSPGQQARASAPDAPPAVYGRGASDMKGGVAAFLVLLRHFARHRDDWAGRLTLCLVCDEETFGPHGIRSLLGDQSLFEADAVLTSEPSGRGMIRHGERGPVWGTVVFGGTPGHGAYSASGETNVIVRAGRFCDDLTVKFAGAFPRPTADTPVSGPGPEFHPGGDSVSLNVGTIEGGTKLNTKPSSCSVEIDVRVPVGVPALQTAEWLAQLATEHGGNYRPLVVCDGNVTDPSDSLFVAMAGAIRVETGLTAGLEVALGSTDARHWRRRGIPVAQYGADPLAQAMPDEHVPVHELGEIARVHARTAAALLTTEQMRS